MFKEAIICIQEQVIDITTFNCQSGGQISSDSVEPPVQLEVPQ